MPSLIAPIDGFSQSPTMLGPFESSQGKLFAVLLDTGANRLQVWRSTDIIGNTWHESESGGARPIGDSFAGLFFAPTFAGDVIYIAYCPPGRIGDTFPTAIARFDCLANGWMADFSGGPFLGPVTVVIPKLFLARRSTGVLVMAYPGADELISGTLYSRLAYVTCSAAGVWGTPATIGSGIAAQFDPQGLLLARDDRVHIFISNRTGGLKQRALRADNTLAALQDVASTSPTYGTVLYGAGVYDDSIHTSLVPAYDASAHVAALTATDGDTPTWADDVFVNDAAFVPSTFLMGAVVGLAAVAGLVRYIFYVVPDDNGILSLVYQINVNGAGWSPHATLLFRSTGTIFNVSPALLSIGIGVIFDEDPDHAFAGSPTRTMFVLLPNLITSRSYSY